MLNSPPEGEFNPHSLATDIEGRTAYALVWSRRGIVTSVQVIGYYFRLDRGWRAVGVNGEDLGTLKHRQLAQDAILKAWKA